MNILMQSRKDMRIWGVGSQSPGEEQLSIQMFESQWEKEVFWVVKLKLFLGSMLSDKWGLFLHFL